ncbi:MAG: MscL family protein [Candidatus Bathyarchaeum sp.]|nr:MAG: MscL family protein [Candidatus Bathyarchaeum sp.]
MSKEDEMIKELTRIRELLTPKPTPPSTPPKGVWNEFKDFLSKYKVMGLAVAFIMGVYLGGLVQSLVKDLLLPVIGLAMQDVDLASLQYNVEGQIFGIGNFLVALITFIIVAFVIFILVKVTKRWELQ